MAVFRKLFKVLSLFRLRPPQQMVTTKTLKFTSRDFQILSQVIIYPQTTNVTEPSITQICHAPVKCSILLTHRYFPFPSYPCRSQNTGHRADFAHRSICLEHPEISALASAEVRPFFDRLQKFMSFVLGYTVPKCVFDVNNVLIFFVSLTYCSCVEANKQLP